MSLVDTSKDLKRGVYVGAAFSVIFILTPYVNQIGILAYIVGPVVGMWFLVRKQKGQDFRYTYNQAAQVGFYAAFCGAIIAIGLSTMINQFIDQELWKLENLYLIPPLIAELGLDTDGAEGWYLWMFQLILISVMSGAFGAPSRLLGLKLFQKNAEME